MMSANGSHVRMVTNDGNATSPADTAAHDNTLAGGNQLSNAERAVAPSASEAK